QTSLDLLRDLNDALPQVDAAITFGTIFRRDREMRATPEAKGPSLVGRLAAQNPDDVAAEGGDYRHTGDVAGTIPEVNHILDRHSPFIGLHRLVHGVGLIGVFRTHETLLDREHIPRLLRKRHHVLDAADAASSIVAKVAAPDAVN